MGAVEALDMNYDARQYTVCCPWYGQRSSLFRLWQQAFRAGVADELDDDSSLDETADGTDLGGDQSVAVLGPRCDECWKPSSCSQCLSLIHI